MVIHASIPSDEVPASRGYFGPDLGNRLTDLWFVFIVYCVILLYAARWRIKFINELSGYHTLPLSLSYAERCKQDQIRSRPRPPEVNKDTSQI